MFGIFKFRKLYKLLEEANISTSSTDRLNLSSLELQQHLFDPRKDGKQNFSRLVQMLYEDHPSCVRIKLLIAIHRIIGKQPLLAEQFMQHEPREYQGVKIKRRQDRSPLKQKSQKQEQVKRVLAKLDKLDREEKMDRSGRSKDLSPQPSRSKRYSIDEEILYEDASVYLLVYLVKPFESYLLKLAAHYETYEQCKYHYQQKAETDFVMVWKLINMCKSLAPFRQVLTHIGRYYLSESKYIVDFLEAITKDIFYFYRTIEQHVAKALEGFSKMDQLQMENIIGIVEELPDLNEALYEIFYGRYFYKLIRNVRSPKWINLTNEQVQLMHRTHRLRYGKPDQRGQKHHYSMTISENRQGLLGKKSFEDINLSFGAERL